MLKRALDITLAGFGLAVSLPAWVAIALAIRLDDGGPVFYRQPRVGRGGHEFTSYKFRSMVANSDSVWGAVPAVAGDARITRVGRLLRATAMDELPQLWNILRGDMSFVGPRPEWVELVKEFRREIPNFDRRHAVRPGLTGFAQVYGSSELPRRQKLRYDVLYIKRRNLWVDIRLIFISFLVTLMGRWESRSQKFPRWMSGRSSRRPKGAVRMLKASRPSLSPVEDK